MSLREALLDARRDTVTHRAALQNLIVNGLEKIFETNTLRVSPVNSLCIMFINIIIWANHQIKYVMSLQSQVQS